MPRKTKFTDLIVRCPKCQLTGTSWDVWRHLVTVHSVAEKEAMELTCERIEYALARQFEEREKAER